MKKIVCSLLLALITLSVEAQEKQTVHSIIVEWHETEWYLTQEKLWKAEVDKDNKNADAWMNYYSAVRAVRNCSSENEKLRNSYTELGHKIAKECYAILPESFESNYIMYWDGGLGISDEKFLKKAFDIKPNDPRVLLDYLINSEIKRDKNTFSKVAKKLYEINRMPSGALNWAYNVLTEVSENGIVFTAGDNDTYALWIVQEAMNYRKDVTVINTSLILLADYRVKILKEKGISPVEFEHTEAAKYALFKHLFENNANIPVHVSVSASSQFTDSNITDHLYLTGLTYVYSSDNVENIALIKRNFEKRFLLDHLTKTFSNSYGDLDTRIKHMYLPGLIKMYKHSLSADDLEGVAYYGGLLNKIAKELGIEAEIQKTLAE
ncbi:MAG: hypothetical protein KA734_12040 [Fluviicola sp.]|nr:hypothetical protein [Fluviicola sp.]